MSDREDDNDAPEEFTAEQGAQQEDEIRKIQKESKVRVTREKKERRRKLAQRLTPRPPKKGKDSQDASETETETVICMKHLPPHIFNYGVVSSEKGFFLTRLQEILLYTMLFSPYLEGLFGFS